MKNKLFKIIFTMSFLLTACSNNESKKECEHFFSIERTNDACTEGVITTYSCSKCGYKYQTSEKALGHDYIDKHDDEYHWKECERCQNIIDKESHKYTISGHNDDFHWKECEICNAVKKEEHFYNDHICECGNTVYSEGLTYSFNSNNTYTVIGIGKCKDKSVFIPSTYRGLLVTTIGDNAFSNCSSLTSINIPTSVTSIGDHAFSGCSSLISIVVEEENPIYDSRDNCNAIIETSTNKLIFGCQSTIIPNSVTSIGDYAFSGCSSLTSINIPTSVTSIGRASFSNCSSLTSIAIPNSISSIEWDTFSNCSSLISINIPTSVTSIAGDAFSGCSSLTSIVVEDGNPVYDSRDNCNAIIESSMNKLIFGCQSTIIPTSVTSIDWEAFSNCSSLASITIPCSVTSIGDHAFSGCSSLTSIVVEDGNPVYDSRDNCNAIIESSMNKLIFGCQSTIIPNSVTSIGSGAFGGCSSLTSIIIPTSVTLIENNAFSGCSSLTSIIIPTSVTSIWFNAFSGCSSLTIYCEAPSCPSGWDPNWNLGNCPVVWGYKS